MRVSSATLRNALSLAQTIVQSKHGTLTKAFSPKPLHAHPLATPLLSSQMNPTSSLVILMAL